MTATLATKPRTRTGTGRGLARCIHCGDEFTPSPTSRRLCSPTCARERQRQQRNEHDQRTRQRQRAAGRMTNDTELGIRASDDTGPYAVSYEIDSPYSGRLPIVHGQFADAGEAMAAAEQVAKSRRVSVRVELWTNAGRKSGGGGGRDGETLVAVVEPPQGTSQRSSQGPPQTPSDGDKVMGVIDATAGGVGGQDSPQAESRKEAG